MMTPNLPVETWSCLWQNWREGIDELPSRAKFDWKETRDTARHSHRLFYAETFTVMGFWSKVNLPKYWNTGKWRLWLVTRL